MIISILFSVIGFLGGLVLRQYFVEITVVHAVVFGIFAYIAGEFVEKALKRSEVLEGSLRLGVSQTLQKIPGSPNGLLLFNRNRAIAYFTFTIEEKPQDFRLRSLSGFRDFQFAFSEGSSSSNLTLIFPLERDDFLKKSPYERRRTLLDVTSRAHDFQEAIRRLIPGLNINPSSQMEISNIFALSDPDVTLTFQGDLDSDQELEQEDLRELPHPAEHEFLEEEVEDEVDVQSVVGEENFGLEDVLGEVEEEDLDPLDFDTEEIVTEEYLEDKEYPAAEDIILEPEEDIMGIDVEDKQSQEEKIQRENHFSEDGERVIEDLELEEEVEELSGDLEDIKQATELSHKVLETLEAPSTFSSPNNDVDINLIVFPEKEDVSELDSALKKPEKKKQRRKKAIAPKRKDTRQMELESFIKSDVQESSSDEVPDPKKRERLRTPA